MSYYIPKGYNQFRLDQNNLSELKVCTQIWTAIISQEPKSKEFVVEGMKILRGNAQQTSMHKKCIRQLIQLYLKTTPTSSRNATEQVKNLELGSWTIWLMMSSTDSRQTLVMRKISMKKDLRFYPSSTPILQESIHYVTDPRIPEVDSYLLHRKNFLRSGEGVPMTKFQNTLNWMNDCYFSIQNVLRHF